MAGRDVFQQELSLIVGGGGGCTAFNPDHGAGNRGVAVVQHDAAELGVGGVPRHQA